MNPKISIVTFGGRRWLRITPPWVKGYRPASTLRPLHEKMS